MDNKIVVNEKVYATIEYALKKKDNTTVGIFPAKE